MDILCFGSLNIDHVYAVPHFVQAGETLSSASLHSGCGGKGLNQSIALSRAGASVRHAGLVGQDDNMLRPLLADNGVDITAVRTADVPSGHAIIQVDESGQNCILLYSGANRAIDRSFVCEVLDTCRAGDILLLQNEISEIRTLLEEGAARGLRIAFNPAPITAELADMPIGIAEWLFVNETEGAALSGETANDRIITALREKYPHTTVILTVGGDGVIAADDAGIHRLPAMKVPVADTTAAGDTFIGYFLAAVAEGSDLQGALHTASAASALTVSRAGAAASIPMADEVKRFLQGRQAD